LNCINKRREYLWTIHSLKIALPLAFLVVGCQNRVPQKTRPVEPTRVSAPVQAPEAAQSSQGRSSMATCQRELIALSKVNQRSYAQKKAEFDLLLSRASVYTSVRDEIGAQTKDTMDALYKFKTQKLCSDIEIAVRQSLLSTGESIK